jgi:cell division protein FtsW
MQWLREVLKDNEQLYLVALMSLCAFGFVMVGSSSYVFSLEKYGEGFYFLKRHGVHLVVGASLFFAFKRFGLLEFSRLTTLLWLGLAISLILVLIPGIGVSVGGARRWVRIGLLNFQPVEFLKALYPFLYSLFVFKFIEKNGVKFRSLINGIIPLLSIPTFFTVLLLLQPDFGSVVLLWIVSFSILFFCGLKFFHIVTILSVLGGGFWAALVFSPYRMQRFLTFLDPWKDPYGKGFQIIQSFAAFHNGGVLGKGLGNSQAKRFFLPAAQNDFIFSIIGEELGFAGVLIVILLFLLLLKSAVSLALRCESEVKSVAIMAFVALVASQAFINMAVAMGIVPNKGLTLPFLSYGGSSIVALLLGAGLLYGLATKREEELFSFSLLDLKVEEKRNKKDLRDRKKAEKEAERAEAPRLLFRTRKTSRSEVPRRKSSSSVKLKSTTGKSKKKTYQKSGNKEGGGLLGFFKSESTSRSSSSKKSKSSERRKTKSSSSKKTVLFSSKRNSSSKKVRRKTKGSIQSISSFGKGNSKSRSKR